jgi:hypothetical protein
MLQQRQSIGWLKQPLEHTPETVTSLTYDALYEHLGGQFARLSVDERMQWLDNLNYIVTPHGRKLIYTLQQFIGANIAREHRKLLILGGAGTGKTDNVHRFMTHCNNLPVIAVMSPSYKAGRTTRTLVSYLLEACHVDVKPRTRYTTMTRQLREAVEQQEIHTIIVDEVSFMRYDLEQQHQFLEIVDALPASLVGVSSNPATWLDWTDTTILPACTDEYFHQFLLFMDLILPFPERSIDTIMKLYDDACEEAHIYSKGTKPIMRISYIVPLLCRASRRAMKQGEHKLLMKTLTEAQRRIY